MSERKLFGEEFLKLSALAYELGFDGLLYSFYPKPMYMNSKIQPVLYFSPDFAPFVRHYWENDYGNRDFVLRMALEGKEKIIDWWDEIDAGRVTPAERTVAEDARQNFGIHYGLSIPVLRGTFAIAGISVISKREDRRHFETLKLATTDTLRNAAKDYHAKIMRSKEELRFSCIP